MPFDDVDLGALEQELDAPPYLVNDFVLAGEHDLIVHLRLADVDAVLASVLCEVHHMGALQKDLAGNAAAMEADAALFVLLDERDLLAQLCGADCRRIAAGAATKHDNIVLLCPVPLPQHVRGSSLFVSAGTRPTPLVSPLAGAADYFLSVSSTAHATRLSQVPVPRAQISFQH